MNRTVSFRILSGIWDRCGSRSHGFSGYSRKHRSKMLRTQNSGGEFGVEKIVRLNISKSRDFTTPGRLVV